MYLNSLLQIEAGNVKDVPVTRWHLADETGEERVVSLWREHAAKRAPLDSPVKITNLKVTDNKGVRYYNSSGLTDVHEVWLLLFSKLLLQKSIFSMVNSQK